VSGFTQAEAQGVYDLLAQRCFDVSLHFSYREKLMPAENYAVVVPVAVGGMRLDRLRELVELADEWRCDVHLIDGGLRLFPRNGP
jgi:hypothetical protein